MGQEGALSLQQGDRRKPPRSFFPCRSDRQLDLNPFSVFHSSGSPVETILNFPLARVSEGFVLPPFGRMVEQLTGEASSGLGEGAFGGHGYGLASSTSRVVDGG